MHIGLYSELARRDIATAQDLIVTEGYEPTTEGIRRFRVDLQLVDRWRPFRWLTAVEDFYDTSGCRDLLFHVQEHQLTIAEIAAFLREHKLQFIGFELAPQALTSYRSRLPQDSAMTDLNAWEAFEAQHPTIFAGMYQFWVQRL